MIAEMRCLYCGQACDREHHVDPLRDEHRPFATGAGDAYVDASTPVALPPRSQDQRRLKRGLGRRRGQSW